MPIKDILAFVISLEADQSALWALRVLMKLHAAHASVLVLEVRPGSEFEQKPSPLSAVLEDIALGSAAQAIGERHRIETWLGCCDAPVELRSFSLGAALRDHRLAVAARHADLSIITRPCGAFDANRWMIWESVLFGSGRPVLLTPPGWRSSTLGRRILIAWNAKREASRAVADAMPFIIGADKVVVATVDAAPSGEGHGERPGHDIALHLARQGAKVEVQNLDGLGRAIGVRLLEAADAAHADLIVMGGYGHARAAEWLLGGVTRDMIEMADIPILMSH